MTSLMRFVVQTLDMPKQSRWMRKWLALRVPPGLGVWEGAAQVSGAEDDGGAAFAGAEGDFVGDEDAFIEEHAHGRGQAEGGDSANGVARGGQQLVFGGRGEARLAEVPAQRAPRDLVATGNQDHDKFPLAHSKDDAADDLLGLLAALDGGLLQRRDGAGMAEEAMRDAQRGQGARNGRAIGSGRHAVSQPRAATTAVQ